MRVVIVARQLGHSASFSAHEAQARKWLHGPKTTVRGASVSMQIVQRRRSSSASFSRLTWTSAPAVASVAAYVSQSVFGPFGPPRCRPCVCGHQAHFQEGAEGVFFLPFFLPPRADIVIY